MAYQAKTHEQEFYSIGKLLDLHKELNVGLEKLNQYIHQQKEADYFEKQRRGLTTHAYIFDKIRMTNRKILALAEEKRSVC